VICGCTNDVGNDVGNGRTNNVDCVLIVALRYEVFAACLTIQM